MKSYFLLIVAIMIVFSCSEDDGDNNGTETKSEIADKNWKLKGLTCNEPFDFNAGIQFINWDYSVADHTCGQNPNVDCPTDLFGYVRPCEKDDYYFFSSSSVFTIKRNSLCAASDGLDAETVSNYDYSSWKIENDKLILHDDGSVNPDEYDGAYYEIPFDIVELSATSLVIKGYLSGYYSDRDLEFTYTFKIE